MDLIPRSKHPKGGGGGVSTKSSPAVLSPAKGRILVGSPPNVLAGGQTESNSLDRWQEPPAAGNDLDPSLLCFLSFSLVVFVVEKLSFFSFFFLSARWVSLLFLLYFFYFRFSSDIQWISSPIQASQSVDLSLLIESDKPSIQIFFFTVVSS
ncbi:hypothetical protein NE237_031133 [Protea cynaroides]|uniref:Uncharacterized protein n=1 Tax=Protea cynaroides TaxID=273540 RepID=A0A9Q0L1H8_9MAGN|nr:hypothetical protein NE237_031133 [Protea cynaroides]